ncbi:MAG: CHAD domain-containing protein [Bacteroidetes bacterium]|nr:CHAD domain-containing protein [Bacteroidota bacterium]
MKRKAEKAYFNELWDEMESSLGGFLHNGEQEKLHRFRVQVKKLRALLLLLDTALGDKILSKGFKPVRKIFKQGGVIREAYINIQLSSHYDLKNDEFIQEQVDGMEKAIIEFRDNGKKHLKTIKEVHGELEHKLQGIDDEQVSEFYKQQLEQIALALSSNQFGDDLHDCRKRIKTLVYNRKVAGEALEGNLDLNSDYLDKLQGQIGEWHDTILAIQLFSSPQINAKPVVMRIKRQHTRLQTSIRRLSADFWKRATYADKEMVNVAGS